MHQFLQQVIDVSAQVVSRAEPEKSDAFIAGYKVGFDIGQQIGPYLPYVGAALCLIVAWKLWQNWQTRRQSKQPSIRPVN